jgi:TRAP-type transport system periplasmic protein
MSANFGTTSVSRRSFLKAAGFTAAAVAGGPLLAACGSSKKKSSDSAKYSWRTGTVVSTADPFYSYLTTMAAAIREKTNGDVKLDVFPNGQLGAEADTFKLLQSGAIQFNAISTVTVNATVPSTVLYSLPYVLDPSNPAKMRAAYTGATSKKQRDDLAKIGVQVLNFVNNGTRHIGAKKTFATPDDMKGVKIRVPGTPLYEGVFKSFGAVPTPLALTDVYSALQQGLVTAYEQPLPGIQAEKWYESANQITLVSYSITPCFVGVNKNLWATLPSKIQTGIEDAVESASSTFDSKTLPAHQTAAQDALKGLGATFVTPDLTSWKSSAAAVYNQFADQVGGMDLIDQLRNG